MNSKTRLIRVLRWIDKQGIGLCLFTVLLPRLAFIAVTSGRDSYIMSDEAKYVGYAVSLVERGAYELGGEKLLAWVTPGYPLVLAGVYGMFGQDVGYIVGRLLNVLFDLGTCYLMFRLGWVVFQSRRMALASAWGFALFPTVIRWLGVSALLTESLFTLLLVLVVYRLVKAYASGDFRSGPALVTGLTLGFAALVRSTVQLFPAVLIVLEGWWAWRSRQVRCFQHWVRILAICAGFALMVGPWLARNYFQVHLLSMTSSTGYVLYTSTNYVDDGDMLTMKAEIIPLRLSMAEAEFSAEMTRRGIENLRRGGVNSIGLALKQATRFWFSLPPLKGRAPSRRAVLTAPLTMATLLLAAIGMGRKWPGRAAEVSRMLCSSLIGYFVILHLLVIGDSRYAVPVLPLVVMYAVSGLGVVWQAIQARRKPTALAR